MDIVSEFILNCDHKYSKFRNFDNRPCPRGACRWTLGNIIIYFLRFETNSNSRSFIPIKNIFKFCKIDFQSQIILDLYFCKITVCIICRFASTARVPPPTITFPAPPPGKKIKMSSAKKDDAIVMIPVITTSIDLRQSDCSYYFGLGGRLWPDFFQEKLITFRMKYFTSGD